MMIVKVDTGNPFLFQVWFNLAQPFIKVEYLVPCVYRVL